MVTPCRTLDTETCERIINGMWDHAEYISMNRISRDNCGTWKTELQNTFYPNHGMLMQHTSWGHSQVVWDVRCDPRVVEGYKRIYPGHSKFTVSYDGVSFGLAPKSLESDGTETTGCISIKVGGRCPT